MEHLQHFGLNQDPFSNEPDLRFFFESASHLDAQRRIERSLRQSKGLTLLTGAGGIGKTLLARRILDSLEEEVFEAVLLVMLPGVADTVGILQRFARQLGTEDPAEDRAGLLAQIYDQLAIVREDGRHSVLMIDDAQIMGPGVLSELTGLLNLEYEDRRLVSLLLVGSPELDRIIGEDSGIAPRVEVRVRIRPFDPQSTTAYLEHRLSRVGGSLALIQDSALETLHKFGRGRPRLLNTLADNALFEAYLDGRTSLEPIDVERAAADLGVGADPDSTWVSPTPMAPSAAVASFDSTPQESPAMPAMPDPVAPEVGLGGMDEFMQSEAFEEEEPLLDEVSPLAELELSMDMVEPTTTAVATDEAPTIPAMNSPMPELGVDLESLEFEAEPVNFALEEAELTAADGEELEGVYVELIEE